MLTEGGNIDFDLGSDTGGAPTGDSGGATPDAGGAGTGAEATPLTPYPEMFRFNRDDFTQLGQVPLPSTAEAEAAATAAETAPAPAPAVAEAPPAADAAAPATEEAAAPAAALSTPAGIADPLFAPFDTPEAGVGLADKFVADLHEMDPGRANLLYNAVFDSQRPAMTGWVLQELGLDPSLAPALQEKAATISEWLQQGGDLPAQEAAEQFPQPDQFQVVTMPDGTELDLSKPVDKRAYDAEKALFDRTQADNKAAADSTRTAQEDARTALETQADARVTAFGQERSEAIKQNFAGLNLNYGEGNEWASQAAMSHARDLCFADPEIRALNAEGERLAREGGTRLSSVAQDIDAKIAAHITTAVERFNGVMLNANRAERAARSTDPVLPAGTQQIAAGAAAATASPQNQGKPLTMDGTVRSIAQEIEAALC